ncbi:MAG TPA: GNAT family N-acetyltransferase [Coleofasciculaceae cyanobacterium]
MLVLRPATQSDISVIHDVTQAAYADCRSRLPYSSIWQETPAAIADELNLGPIFLAFVNAALVGSVRCHSRSGGELWNQFMYVHRLAVLPAYRQQGIGRTLMQAVENLAQDSGLEWVCLEVRAAQPENQQFYEKLGYTLGSVSGYLPTGAVRSFWMSKALMPKALMPKAL